MSFTPSAGTVRNEKFTFSTTQATRFRPSGPSTAIRGFLYGNGIGFRFTDLQTKANTHKLKVNGFSVTLS